MHLKCKCCLWESLVVLRDMGMKDPSSADALQSMVREETEWV